MNGDYIDAATARRLLRYDAETGKLFWRDRPDSAFKSKRSASVFRARFAGKEAFTATMKNGYKTGRILDRQYTAHRVIMLMLDGEWPLADVDHINRDRSDNRACNLRHASRSQNMANSPSRKYTRSKHKGVIWRGGSKPWRAAIGSGENTVFLGNFHNEVEAAEAYAQAAKSTYGEFAYLEAAR